MLSKSMRSISILVVAILALTTTVPALAEKPIFLLDEITYDEFYFNCGDFDVWGEGVYNSQIRVLFDEEGLLESNVAQTSYRGTLYNKTTGKYLIENEGWTWVMKFEDGVSWVAQQVGSVLKLTAPNEGQIIVATGIIKFEDVIFLPDEMWFIFPDPVKVAGRWPDGETLIEDICSALR